MEISMEDPQNPEGRTSTQPHLSLLGVCLVEAKSTSQRHACTSVFIDAVFTTGKKWIQPRFLSRYGWTDRWMDEGKELRVHNGALLAEEGTVICRKMGGAGDYDVQ